MASCGLGSGFWFSPLHRGPLAYYGKAEYSKTVRKLTQVSPTIAVFRDFATGTRAAHFVIETSGPNP